MDPSSDQSSLKSIWALARAQHWVVTWEQLIAYGFSPHAIKHRVVTGRLHRVGRGLYAVGRPELSRHGRWMAAVLCGGPSALLSHESAAALWGIRDAERDLEISVPGERRVRRAGVRVHRRAHIAALGATTRHRIPLTAPVCTLVDLAARLTSDELEATINEADKQDLIDPDALRSAVAGYGGWPGVAPLRTTLDGRTFTLTDSQLERRFLPIARRAGLPRPQTQTQVNGFRVDFHWPELKLVVETDGLRYHRTAAQQARDRLRDQTHLAAGLTPLRFTRAQVRYHAQHVEATLKAVAGRLLA